MVDNIKHYNEICADTVAEGKLKTTGDISIKGHFTGEVQADHAAYVSRTGRVMGSLRAGHADLEGTVEGMLEGTEIVSLESSASVSGVIVSPKMKVQPGADLVAFCAITPDSSERNKAKDSHAGSADSSNVQTVSFSFSFPNAKKVEVIGDFCGWDESKAMPCYLANNGEWTAQIQLLPGRYEYLILADGKQQLDPTNKDKVPNNYGGQNSLITIHA